MQWQHICTREDLVAGSGVAGRPTRVTSASNWTRCFTACA